MCTSMRYQRGLIVLAGVKLTKNNLALKFKIELYKLVSLFEVDSFGVLVVDGGSGSASGGQS